MMNLNPSNNRHWIRLHSVAHPYTRYCTSPCKFQNIPFNTLAQFISRSHRLPHLVLNLVVSIPNWWQIIDSQGWWTDRCFLFEWPNDKAQERNSNVKTFLLIWQSRPRTGTYFLQENDSPIWMQVDYVTNHLRVTSASRARGADGRGIAW